MDQEGKPTDPPGELSAESSQLEGGPRAGPLLRNPVLRAAMIEAFRNGCTERAAQRALGLNDLTLTQYRRVVETGRWTGTARLGNDDNKIVNPATLAVLKDFLRQVDKAKAELEAEMAERLVMGARATNEKTGIPEWRAAVAFLQNAPATRQHWHPYREMPGQQPPTQIANRVIDVKALNDEELEQLASGEPAPVVDSEGAKR